MKYTCSACGKVWESSEEPFECPNCHSGNISSDAPSAIVQSFAKYWWLIVLSIVCSAAIVLIPAGSDEPDSSPAQEETEVKKEDTKPAAQQTSNEVTPDFTCSAESNLDRTPYTYTVTIKVKNLYDLKDVTYSLNGVTQRESIFRNVPDNQTCTVVVANGKKTASQELQLKKIVPPKSISKGEVQSILDQVANGSMSAGAAKAKICRGEIKLASPVDGKSTLSEALQKLELAATLGEKIHYTVVDFKTDKKTGQIISGTLSLRKS